MGRKRGWGGSEPRAEASLGRKRAWGGSEAGAEARPGRKGVWSGGREYGAEGTLGRKGVWGGREAVAQGAPRHTNLHFDPQATTFLSPPGGIYLILNDPSIPSFNRTQSLPQKGVRDLNPSFPN
jgi:hypothetical protein